jgi:hypothetical protein
VTDESNAVIPGATVTARSEATNIERIVATGAQGEYRIANLLPGVYTVTVEQASFKKGTKSGVEVRINESVRVDFTMQIGAVTETVEVTMTAPLLETSSSTIGRVVTNEKIVQLPLNGQRFYAFDPARARILAGCEQRNRVPYRRYGRGCYRQSERSKQLHTRRRQQQ